MILSAGVLCLHGEITHNQLIGANSYQKFIYVRNAPLILLPRPSIRKVLVNIVHHKTIGPAVKAVPHCDRTPLLEKSGFEWDVLVTT